MSLNDSEVVDVAWLLLSANENDTAINLLQKLSKRQNPTCPSWAQFDLALTYLLNGNYENAAEQANIFLKTQHPVGEASAETASAWSVVGIAKAHLNHGEASVEAFRQAAKLDPTSEAHWLNLTRELMDLNHYADAISAAQQGLDANPKSYALHLRWGAAYLSVDRYSEAENIFRQLVNAGDPLPMSYVGLAQVGGCANCITLRRTNHRGAGFNRTNPARGLLAAGMGDSASSQGNRHWIAGTPAVGFIYTSVPYFVS